MLFRNNNVQMTDSGGGSSQKIKTEESKKTERQTLGKPNKQLEPLREETQSETPYEPKNQTVERPTFESLFSDMLTRFMPETVAYQPLDAETIRAMLIDWLRPAYDQAIANRRALTERNNAELDADAWARGMGASTYVTDVKGRALDDEARDVGTLESNYASTLAAHLFDAMKSQQTQALAVDKFNAEQRNRAKERAYSAATALYQAYTNEASSGGTGGASTERRTNTGGASTEQRTSANAAQSGETPLAASVTVEETTDMLARMTPETRKQLYAGKGSYAKMYREIKESIGMNAFRNLMKAYPTKA